MKKVTQSEKIRKGIISFYKTRKSFKTADLLKFIQKKIDTVYIMPDTILREMRQLKQDNILDYNCPVKKDMLYFVTKRP